eukprot:scaffold140510_cov2369-Phaeocystis_antarctica.AAC.1
MSDAGRVPLWMVATIGGLAALGLLTLFVFGAYSGLGSSLGIRIPVTSVKGRCPRPLDDGGTSI